jgi:hypothetical protein
MSQCKWWPLLNDIGDGRGMMSSPCCRLFTLNTIPAESFVNNVRVAELVALCGCFCCSSCCCDGSLNFIEVCRATDANKGNSAVIYERGGGGLEQGLTAT